MGQRVEFPSNSHTCQGYMAIPASGSGAGIVVIQEWWGLVPHIEGIVDRFASEGFVAVAPDLYHGKTTKSPDDAAKLLMELDVDRAESEIAGAATYLLGRPECTSKLVGVIGFCMGGALAQYTATKERSVGAAVSFYGGFKKAPMAWQNLSAPILLIYGENDGGVPADQGRELGKKLKEMGKNAQVVVFPNANHAFFNDTGRSYNPEASADAWKRTIDFFSSNVK